MGWVCSELRSALEHEAEQYRSRKQAKKAAMDAEKERLITELLSARAELSRIPSSSWNHPTSPAGRRPGLSTVAKLQVTCTPAPLFCSSHMHCQEEPKINLFMS